MKTTPDGLTHLINMLVDVVNMQRKALATPGASCVVEVGFQDSSLVVHVIAQADLYADPPTVTLQSGAPFSAENNRQVTEADVDRHPGTPV